MKTYFTNFIINILNLPKQTPDDDDNNVTIKQCKHNYNDENVDVDDMVMIIVTK